jgi:hypothetical protein
VCEAEDEEDAATVRGISMRAHKMDKGDIPGVQSTPMTPNPFPQHRGADYAVGSTCKPQDNEGKEGVPSITDGGDAAGADVLATAAGKDSEAADMVLAEALLTDGRSVQQKVF